MEEMNELPKGKQKTEPNQNYMHVGCARCEGVWKKWKLPDPY